MRTVDVAIVGLGPVGAVLANLLGGAGLQVAVFERDANILAIPRAVALDGEIMRVIQAAGLAQTLEPLLKPSTGGQFIDPAGNLMLRRAPSEQEGPQGWRPFYNFHQPTLEQVLRAGLERYPNVEVCLRHDVFAVDEKDDVVLVRVENMATGALETVQARLIVGCDGARSLIRRLIGSTLDDLGLHEPWVVADFELTRDVPALPPTSTQYCDPVGPVTYVHVIHNRRRFEFKLPPGSDLSDAANAENVWARASRWLTPDDAKLTRAALYTFHSLIARTWCRGRLVIAGDSAHQTPPFMGQGLCAGVRDAANLAWKIVRVLRNDAPMELLDTYGSERRAHAQVFIQMAVHLGRVLGAGSAEEMHALSAEVARGGGSLVHPTPQLGEGLFEDSPGAGVIAPQPRLANGERLDDRLDYSFALVGEKAALRRLSPACRRDIDALDIRVVEATGAVLDWLAKIERPLVLLRPDRYVLASMQEMASLERVLGVLRARIGDRAVAA